jgi:hypothetical protein
MDDLISKKALLAGLHKELIGQGSVSYRKVKELITAAPSALSEIEKCEPVGIFDGNFTGDINGNVWIKLRMLTGIPKINTKFYTSPISKEWVYLTYNQKVELTETTDANLSPLDLVIVTEMKLKQLNTEKG